MRSRRNVFPPQVSRDHHECNRLFLDRSINWERSSLRAALQKGIWGCWSAAGSIGASRVPWQPGGQTVSWGASNTAQPDGQER